LRTPGTKESRSALRSRARGQPRAPSRIPLARVGPWGIAKHVTGSVVACVNARHGQLGATPHHPHPPNPSTPYFHPRPPYPATLGAEFIYNGIPQPRQSHWHPVPIPRFETPTRRRQAAGLVLCSRRTPRFVPKMKFNLFHILGDVSHTSSKLILIWAIHSNSSAEGGFS